MPTNLTPNQDTALYSDLPDDVRQKEILPYLDTASLSRYARVNQKALAEGIDELTQRVAAQSINLGSAGNFIWVGNEVFACGYNYLGQLGLGDNLNRNSFTNVPNIPGKVLQIAAGLYSAYLLTDQGLFACGGNRYGQLGLGDNIDRNTFTNVPNIPGKVLQIVVDYFSAYMLTDQGLLTCGYNYYGQLGLGDNMHRNTFTQVPNIQGKVLQIAAGFSSVYILTDQGLLACGWNEYGQLGLGDNMHRNTFTQVSHIPDKVLQIAAGDASTYVLTDQGLLVCGNNDYGQLGLGDNMARNTFTLVPNIQGKVLQIAAGDAGTYVLTDQGLLTCGYNYHGQLGLGDNRYRNTFTQVPKKTLYSTKSQQLQRLLLIPTEIPQSASLTHLQLHLSLIAHADTPKKAKHHAIVQLFKTVTDIHTMNALYATLFEQKDLFAALNLHTHPIFDSFFKKQHVNLFIHSLQAIRIDALAKLQRAITPLTNQEQVRFLEAAKDMPLFKRHRDNYGWGKTNAVKQIERWIAAAQCAYPRLGTR